MEAYINARAAQIAGHVVKQLGVMRSRGVAGAVERCDDLLRQMLTDDMIAHHKALSAAVAGLLKDGLREVADDLSRA